MVERSLFEVHSELWADTGRLTVAGELDIATAPQLEKEVRAMLGQAVGHLIIDLSRVSFIDSSGLRMFFVLSERARAEGWRLELVRPSPQALSVFQISGAHAHLPFIEDPSSP
jgi:anti-anti-sigma factor